jgi:hypothetical protein
MSEHLPSQLIERFLARQLAPKELLLVAEHLRGCEPCRAQLNEGRGTDSAIRYLRADLQGDFLEQTHINYAQLAAYVDASLPQTERQAVNQHLTACESCAKEATELESFKNSLATYPNLREEKALTAAATNPSSGAGDSQSATSESHFVGRSAPTIWQALVRFVRQKPLQIAFATAVALIAILTASVFLLRSGKQTQSLAELQPPTHSSNQSATKPAGQGNQNESIEQPTHANANTDNPPPGQPQSSGNANRPSAGKPNHAVNGTESFADSSPLPPAYEKVVRQALATQMIAPAEVTDQLIGKRSNLMSKRSASESFALLNPVGTVIQSDRPTFRWQSLPGATSYTIFILDANFNVIVKSEPLSQTSWTTTQPLKRGTFYAWQVTATKDGKALTSPAAPLPEARFKILEPAKSNELQRLAKERPDSHLILGVIYAHNGLLDEAERELQLAINQNQEADTAKKILQSVKSMRQ